MQLEVGASLRRLSYDESCARVRGSDCREGAHAIYQYGTLGPSSRTKESLARKKSEGKRLGRPKEAPHFPDNPLSI